MGSGIGVAAIILAVLLTMTVVFAIAADLSGWVVVTIVAVGAIVGAVLATSSRRM